MPVLFWLIDFVLLMMALDSFSGGAAEKLSNLKAGDEILEINGVSTDKQSRIDVWNMLKKIPQGDSVQLKIKKI
jgi:C-terminal processing protease CtpA/Prc